MSRRSRRWRRNLGLLPLLIALTLIRALRFFRAERPELRK